VRTECSKNSKISSKVPGTQVVSKWWLLLLGGFPEVIPRANEEGVVLLVGIRISGAQRQ
jgi:hypothetical protein